MNTSRSIMKRAFLSWRLRAFLGSFVLCCGCTTPLKDVTDRSDPRSVLSLERGISMAEIQRRIGVPADHEFTIIRQGALIQCVMYHFKDHYIGFFVVFTNDTLSKIILPPGFAHELSPWQKANNTRPVWPSYDPFERIEVVLKAPDLTQEQLSQAIQRRYRPPRFGNVWPAAILAKILEIPNASSVEQVDRAYAARFNAFELRVGSSIGDVQLLFGDPLVSIPLDDTREIHVYGPNDCPPEKIHAFWIGVVFDSGIATSVLTRDFLEPQYVRGGDNLQ